MQPTNKNTGCSKVAAAAVLGAALGLATPSAEAAVLGLGSANPSGTTTTDPSSIGTSSTSPITFTFGIASTGIPDGFLAGYTLNTIQPLTLTKSGGTYTGGPIATWLTFKKAASPDITFDLNASTWSFNYTSSTSWSMQQSGPFTGTWHEAGYSDETGSGYLNMSASSTKKSWQMTIDADFVPVPEPAAWGAVAGFGLLGFVAYRRFREG